MTKFLATLTAGVLAWSGLAAQEPDDASGPVVLTIFAHPDDELIIAPSIARAARERQDVRMIFVTSGDRGPGVSGIDPGEGLAGRREDEARCSARALGVDAVSFLGYGDGALALPAHGAGSPAVKLARDLEALIRETEPDIVVTWGPDGGSGHADHRIVGAIVTQVVQSMEVDRPLLLCPGIRTGTLPPVPQMQDWSTVAAELLPIRYEYGETDLAAAGAAAICHQTQFNAADRSRIAGLLHASVWQGAVHYRPAFPAS
jgi:LmbE family N-acetylglucosaminyl deacetylase